MVLVLILSTIGLINPKIFNCSCFFPQSMNYDRKAVERKWQKYWKEKEIYRFDFNSDAPVYSIDNPPRYASGALHAGHAVNYTQIDFAARFKRMQGYNVFFPLCFDTNGTPIEVKVEKKYNITLEDVDRHEFIEKCREFANGFIEEMTHQFEILGESMDPSIYYQTDAEYYRRLTQISFIRLYKKGLIYKGEFPVNWCPRCGTAISDAEVVYKQRTTKLNYVLFTREDTGEKVTIATTRPELLCSCQLVAVNAADEKHFNLIGTKLLTPIYNKAVPVVDDERVDPTFGTGVVMICTIGDKDDLNWVYEYNLPMEKAIDERGRMTALAGKYAGMSIDEAKKAIIEDLKREGLLIKQEDLEQNVGTCWRCGTPIEFLQVPQWFLKILDYKDEVLRIADEIKWFPEYMKLRLQDWVNSLAWDWPISRQRYFATPIPLWECESCGHVLLAEEKDCYIDPTITPPPRERCEKCGGRMKGCEDVFDTWMDSSISPLYNTFWERDEEKFKKLYPMSLRPQAQDIIRTWAYYTILREYLLVGKRPWDHIMIGAYILSPDGTPMHASKGNVVDPLELLEKYGADAVRYWAATCGLGEDSPVNYKEITRGQRFCTKLWNIEKFIESHVPEPPAEMPEDLGLMERWILSRYSAVVERVTNFMERYEFDRAIKEVEMFAWHTFADHYIELAKPRIEEAGVRYALYHIGLGIAKLAAPILPHLTEEIYHSYYKRIEGNASIHLASWPKPLFRDTKAEEGGELIKDIIAAVRNWKSEKGIPLNAPMGVIECISPHQSIIGTHAPIITSTVKAEGLEFADEDDITERVVAIRPNHAAIGPEFRAEAHAIIEALKNLNVENVPPNAERLHVEVAGRKIELHSRHFELVKESTYHGEAVDVVHVGDNILLLKQE